MTTRRIFLAAAPAFLALGGSAIAALSVPRDPLLGEIPICRGGFQRAQYMQGRELNDPAQIDAAVMEALGLLEGHLIIGRVLLEARQTQLALPHFGHPTTEIYGWLGPQIAARNAAPFAEELGALERAANGGSVGAAWDPVMAKVTALRATVAAERANSQRFRIAHIATMLGDVADDYGNSIERGRISSPLEYHDSAGFLRYAIATANAWSTAPGANAGSWNQVKTELEAVRAAAYPNLLPPQRPPVTIASVRARAAKLQQLAQRA